MRRQLRTNAIAGQLPARTLAALVLVALSAAAGASADRYVETLRLPDGRTLLAYEGEFEARSTGSYSLLLYASAAAGDETTFFLGGIVAPRRGTVEDVLLSDVDGEGSPEVVVVVRSVGTGSYLSVDAYRLLADGLELYRSLGGLPRTSDPVSALRSSR